MPFLQNSLTLLRKIEEYDARGIADGSVVASEVEAAGFGIHTEFGDVVAALIATVKEPAGGVEVEAARIVPASPFFPNICQGAFEPNGKDPDTVV